MTKELACWLTTLYCGLDVELACPSPYPVFVNRFNKQSRVVGCVCEMQMGAGWWKMQICVFLSGDRKNQIYGKKKRQQILRNHVYYLIFLGLPTFYQYQ